MADYNGQYLFIASQTGQGDMQEYFDVRWEQFAASHPEAAEKYFGSEKPPVEMVEESESYVHIGALLLRMEGNPESFQTRGEKILCFKGRNNFVFMALVGEL